MTTPTFTDPATGAVVNSTTSRSGPAPYFADVAARLPQTAEEWQLVPGPDPCLGRALPTVLTRSEAEAGCLVARLPACHDCRAAAEGSSALESGLYLLFCPPCRCVCRLTAIACARRRWRCLPGAWRGRWSGRCWHRSCSTRPTARWAGAAAACFAAVGGLCLLGCPLFVHAVPCHPLAVATNCCGAGVDSGWAGRAGRQQSSDCMQWMDVCYLYITCMTELTLSFVKNACTEGEQAQRHAARAGPTLLEGPMAGLAKPLPDRGICTALPTGHRFQKEPAEFSSL